MNPPVLGMLVQCLAAHLVHSHDRKKYTLMLGRNIVSKDKIGWDEKSSFMSCFELILLRDGELKWVCLFFFFPIRHEALNTAGPPRLLPLSPAG